MDCAPDLVVAVLQSNAAGGSNLVTASVTASASGCTATIMSSNR